MITLENGGYYRSVDGNLYGPMTNGMSGCTIWYIEGQENGFEHPDCWTVNGVHYLWRNDKNIPGRDLVGYAKELSLEDVL